MWRFHLLFILLFFGSFLTAASESDFREIKSAVMEGLTRERVEKIRIFLQSNRQKFSTKNNTLYNKALTLIDEISRLMGQKEPNLKRIESLMNEAFDATRGLDGTVDTLQRLFQTSISRDGVVYHDCEKTYQWVKNAKIGEGIGGSVYLACDVEGTKRNCNYVAKISPVNINSKLETAILRKLDNKNITPKLRDAYICRVSKSGGSDSQLLSVIIMDKFDGSLDRLFEEELKKNLAKKVGNLDHFKATTIDDFLKVVPGSKTYTRTFLETEPFSTLNLIRFIIGEKATFKHDAFKDVPQNIVNIIKIVEQLLERLSDSNIIHRDLKMDNIVYRRVRGSLELAIIDFGQSVDVADTTYQHDLSSFWSANKFVDDNPTYFGDSVVACYDKITLEMELLVKYGIMYTSTAPKACRDAVNNEYVSKLFRKLLKRNNYALTNFVKTSSIQKAKKDEEKTSSDSESGYVEEAINQRANLYYRVLSEDQLKAEYDEP